MNRQEILSSIQENPEISVLIIGAGINGIGTFRDLSAQGVDVLLVDKADFCSGASMASSHMLHGGIRYLENGEFRLVREALTERNLMLRNAPHYAKPLPTTVPMFKWFSGFFNAPLKFLRLRDKPAERGGVVIKLGLVLYDIFARKYRVMPTHSFRLKSSSLQKYPKMNPNIVCSATYYDAWMPTPERICMDLITDTLELSEQSHALNYVSAVDAEKGAVELRDELTGETFKVRPKVVVNAGGPWIDFVNQAMMEEKTRFIGGTKGSHLVLDNPELYEACDGAELFFENQDGRIVLILPYLGKVMVGTTDIRVDDPEDVVTTDEEIDYILGMIPRVFPTIKVDPSQIVFHFSGVRPLPSSDASFTGNVSRDHSIRTVDAYKSGLGFPIYSLIGGKWTSFRAFSEQTTDVVLRTLGRSRNISTENMSIGGGKNYPQDETAKKHWLKRLHERTAVPMERLSTLFDRYGTRAEDFAGFMAAGDDKPLESLPEYTRREVEYIIEQEAALHIDDLVLRRSLIAWLGQINDAVFAELADIFAEKFGWNAEQKSAEMERTASTMNNKHGVKLEMPVA